MTSRPPSALSIFAFLLRRTTANLARRRLKRLREPRYLIGVLIGGTYFYLMFFRSMMRNPPGRGSVLPEAPAAEAATLWRIASEPLWK